MKSILYWKVIEFMQTVNVCYIVFKKKIKILTFCSLVPSTTPVLNVTTDLSYCKMLCNVCLFICAKPVIIRGNSWNIKRLAICLCKDIRCGCSQGWLLWKGSEVVIFTLHMVWAKCGKLSIFRLHTQGEILALLQSIRYCFWWVHQFIFLAIHFP